MTVNTTRNSLLIILAKLGIKIILSAKIILYFPGPITPTRIRASKILGNAVTPSLIRISSSSIKPPKYPVIAPIIVPIPPPINTVSNRRTFLYAL